MALWPWGFKSPLRHGNSQERYSEPRNLPGLRRLRFPHHCPAEVHALRSRESTSHGLICTACCQPNESGGTGG